MNRYMLKSATLAGVVLAMCIVVGVSAGDLNPPPGPVCATDRGRINEQYIEITGLPYVISEPGSYVLTSNLTGVEGQHGIVIDADNVTLDLNGFALIGVPGSLFGITTAGGIHHNVTIRDGIASHWGVAGIQPDLVRGLILQNLHASFNGGAGLHGTTGVIVNCSAYQNGQHGIVAGDSTVIGCEARENGQWGIQNGDEDYCVITQCIIIGNGAGGIHIEEASVVQACSVYNNSGVGIAADGGGCTISGCSVVGNAGGGIQADNSLIRHNAVVGNTNFNIEPNGSTVIENHAPEVP